MKKMAQAIVNTCYTSAGCNRCPFSADWGRNGLICYAYSNSIAVYQPEGFAAGTTGGGILSTLYGHSGKVNAVTWIGNAGCDETELVSGSADGSAIVWCFTNTEERQGQYKPVCTLKGHQGSVTCVTALYLPHQATQAAAAEKETLIVTASIDSTVRVWSRTGTEEAKEIQVIDFKTGFALCVTACIIPGHNVPLLACGCDDHKIHLYARGQDQKFVEVIVLPGHEDWIRDLQFAIDDDGDILLASCAQDQLIRVWRFTVRDHSNDRTVPKSVSELPLDQDIAVKETLFSVTTSDQLVEFAVCLESVLCGHENWVYSIRWQPAQYTGDGKCSQAMKLLSASMDKTMILWSPDKGSGVWVEQVRVGDVGGNTLGFFGGLFSPCGQSILAHGYQGAFNQWTLNQVRPSWFEIARPQIHGYDVQCVAMLGRYSFASGADEKLVRLFSAPKNFINNFCEICGHSTEKELASEESQRLPEGANVPALGLSNKAVFSDAGDGVKKEEEESQKPGQYPENYFSPVSLTAPPSEDQLLQNTLWPEVAKLYGHGYEIYSLAAHPSGKLLASACKAAKAEVANILLWDTETKRQVASLAGCSLTVTQMAFSHSGDFLLAVSRDRTWALYHKTDSGQYVLRASVDKKTSAHSRIIWSCAWSHDDKYFFTASRDKKVMAWSVASVTSSSCSGPPAPVMSQTLPDSVTAIAAAPVPVQGKRYLLAAGLDTGHVSLHLWSDPDVCDKNCDLWSTVKTLSQSEAHHKTVTRLAFRPRPGRLGLTNSEENIQSLELASCGADHAVRVYDINTTHL
ncbi:elongator complex protein 2 [Aplysia californica]|uniref:Elongator complex protein 2 n=1 Tax=Aplysia californica TaxID=6500 RepID=A0ABM1VZ55_APLCA|nr:elongator complex protein 2 [Aplysia californica]